MESMEQGPDENWDDYTERLVAGRDQDMPLWMAANIDPTEDYWEGDSRERVDRWSTAYVAQVETTNEWGTPFGNARIGVSTTERLVLEGENVGDYQRVSVIEIDDTEFTAENARLAAAALIQAAEMVEGLGG